MDAYTPEEDISSHLQNSGKIKVRLWYQEQEQQFSVAVEHVRGLVSVILAYSVDLDIILCIAIRCDLFYSFLGRALKVLTLM